MNIRHTWRRLLSIPAVAAVALVGWQLVVRGDEVRPRRDFAVYLGSGNVWAIDDYEQWLGRPADRFVDFIPRGTWEEIENPGWLIDRWVSANRVVIYSVPMLPESGETSLERGAKGEYDDHFRALAKLLVKADHGGAVLRLGWEFNGNWYPWAANKCPTCFVEYWKRIVDVMRSVQGAQFLFDWNPTLGRQEIAPDQVYPGDKYVDLIGLDTYSDIDAHKGTSPRQQWEVLRTRPYGLNWHRDFAAKHGKPMTFPEWGVTARSEKDREVADDPYFIDAMADWIEANRVEYHGYFEFDAPDGAHALSDGGFPKASDSFRKRFQVAKADG